MFSIMKVTRRPCPIAWTTTISARRCLGSNSTWIKRHLKDPYVKKAVQEDLRARSAYKFMEINDKYKLITKDSFVIDLGASPGGWSVVAAKTIRFKGEFEGEEGEEGKGEEGRGEEGEEGKGEEGKGEEKKGEEGKGVLIAVDLLRMHDIPGVHVINMDFMADECRDEIRDIAQGRKVNLVMSDMLHNTTGNHSTDHNKSMNLSFAALEFAAEVVHKEGSFLCKFLTGADQKELIDEAKTIFKKVKLIKPKASRQGSTEIYLLCMNKI